MVSQTIFAGEAAKDIFDSRLSDLADFGEDWKLTFDDYDGSFEVYGVPPECRLSPEAVAYAFAECGFTQCWLNHTDGWETHYHKGAEQPSRYPKSIPPASLGAVIP